MHPRRRLPPSKLSPDKRAAFVEAFKARRGRIETPEERAAFLASLESVLASATAKQFAWVHNSSFYHLGAVFKPSD
jgi:hypothetical protein